MRQFVCAIPIRTIPPQAVIWAPTHGISGTCSASVAMAGPYLGLGRMLGRFSSSIRQLPQIPMLIVASLLRIIPHLRHMDGMASLAETVREDQCLSLPPGIL